MNWRRTQLGGLVAATVVATAGLSAQPAAAFIYWANNGSSEIGRANNDGTDVTPGFIPAAFPCGVAVDGGHVYWTDNTSPGSIGRAKLNGRAHTDSFITTGTANPCGIAVNASNVFWTNFGDGTIYDAGLNGSGPTQLLGGLTGPKGLALDSHYLYWSNFGAGGAGTTLGRVNLNGSSPNSSFVTSASSPLGVAVNGSSVFFADTGANAIAIAPIAGGTATTLVASVNHPGGIAVDPKHIYWDDSRGHIGVASLGGAAANKQLISGLGTGLGGLAVDTGSEPAIAGEASSAITQFSASLSGMINPEGVASTYHIEYGTTTRYGNRVPVADAVVGSDHSFHRVSQSALGLMPGTNYHWRIVATNGTLTVDGADQTFTTATLSPPDARTGVATHLTRRDATLNGTVNPEGAETTYHFEWGKTKSYGNDVPAFPGAAVGSDSSDHAEAQAITGLVPNTTYHFRIVATNINGTRDGRDQTFTTEPLAPIAQTDPASGVTRIRATLNGEVNPRGAPTTYRFQYGKTSAYGKSVPSSSATVGSDSALHAEQQTISGLSPNTTYHFRIVATSRGGTIAGSDRTFTTGKRPRSRPPAPVLSRLKVTPPTASTSGRLVRSRCVATTRGNRHHRRCSRRLALRITYRLSVPARVTIVVKRISTGRLVGGRCVATTRSNRSDRRCTRVIAIRGRLVVKGAAGASRFKWNGRIGGHRLGPGTYRLIATPAAKGRTGRSRSTVLRLLP